MNPFLLASVYFGLLYALWIFYLAVMALKRARDAGTLSHAALLLGYPTLFIGLLLDVAFNWTFFSLVTFSFPREFTITQHMERLIRSGNSRQRATALWICRNLLDAFDPSGFHCNGE